MIMKNKACRTIQEFKEAGYGGFYTIFKIHIGLKDYDYLRGYLAALFFTNEINDKLYDLLFEYVSVKQYKRPYNTEKAREYYKKTLGRV